jgi:enoyl-CoA hydratase
MNHELLKIELHGSLEILTLNRPEKLNALSIELLLSLKNHFQMIEANPAKVKGVLILGAGEKAFVAGADIAQMSQMSASEGKDFAALAQEVTEMLEKLSCPVIAAVDGFALGGGCELAMACDFIYATEKSQFGQPEVNLGLIPGFGGCVRLQRYVGIGRAREMIYTGRSISASEAMRLGLVNQTFATREEMIKAGIETLELIARKSAFAVSVTKSVLNSQNGKNTNEGLQTELLGFEKAFKHSDKIEGVRAFLEKREAKFLEGSDESSGLTVSF